MKQVFAILSVMLLIIGCDSDVGTGGDGNGIGPDIYENGDNSPGVDNYTPFEDGNEPFEDGSDLPADATNQLDDFLWLEGLWQRFDDIPTGPFEVTVTVEPLPYDWQEYYPDFDALVFGFYPRESGGMPIRKTSENTFEIHFMDGNGFSNLNGVWYTESTEVHLTYTDPATEKVYKYKRP